MSATPAIPKNWPALFLDIARLTSLEVVVAIARSPLAGTSEYLPVAPGRDHLLVKAVGLRTARVIAAAIGGGEIDWPSGRAVLNWWDARRLRTEGWSLTRIARHLRLSERRVRDLVADIPAPVPGAAPPERFRAVMRCPVCGRRRHRRNHGTSDARQIPLPLPIGE
jgi:hypothetical protein